MTKPTSWCIDIRQEHPLLDKFKERAHRDKNGNIFISNNTHYGELKGQLYTSFDDWFITLDQRRERLGKEYYGETRK